MEKLYDRIDWSNNTTPAINETNLNAMSKAIDDIDDRVIEVAGEAVEASAYATAAAGSASEAAIYANNANNYQTSASSSALNAHSNMLTSEGYARGTQDGIAVSSGSQYYHNNSKYYCEHAFSTTPEGYEALVNKVDDILDMIADEWSATKIYSYGMWLHYDDILYKVIAENTVFSAITPPNSTYYEEKSITDALDELSDAIGSEYSSMNEYSVGDIFRYEGNMYRVNVACTGITPPNTNYYTKTTLASLIKSNASDISTLNSSLTNLSDTVSANGAKNLLPLTLDILQTANTAGTWSNNEYTYNGVTFTVNNDNGFVTSIETTGTATANASFRLYPTNLSLSYDYDTILNGCPSGGSASTYRISIEPYSDTGSGVTIPANNSGAKYIYVVSGTNMDNVVFYPMIRRATDADDTFQPYAMTNQELTRILTPLSSLKNMYISINGSTYTTVLDMIEQLFLTVTPSLSAIGVNANGTLLWTGRKYLIFSVTRAPANTYYAQIYDETVMYIARYENSTVYAYEYDGTVLS